MKIFTPALLATLLAASCLHADVTAPVADPDLPQPLDAAFAEALLTESPFTRSVNLEESLQLTGMAYVAGHPVATVFNKATNQSYLVTDQPNELGWHLTAAMAGTDLSNSQVEMQVGPETLVMHYHGQSVSPGEDAKERSKSRLAGKGEGKKASGKTAASSLLGDKGRELYASLSPEARGKFKDLVRSQLDKKPDMTPEQSSAYAQKVFAKIKENDRPSAGGTPKPPKQGKPIKKKQGA